MAITSDLNGKQYKLGRGKVYFDPYPLGISIVAATLGEGERYIGNTPGFTFTSESEDLEHFSSDEGVRNKDASVQLSRSVTGSITCDNISPENQALFVQGKSETVVQTASTGDVDTITVKLGRFYQLGVSVDIPLGVQLVSNVVITKGATPTTVAQPNNYEVDLAKGRIYIEEDAPNIVEGDVLTVTYDVGGGTKRQVISGGQPIYGAIRYEEDNAYGRNDTYYFPHAKLTPDGDYELKGDDWQTMTFAVEFLTKGQQAAIYINGQAEPT